MNRGVRDESGKNIISVLECPYYPVMNLSCMSVWSLCSLFIYSYISMIGLTDMTSYVNMVFV